MTEKRVSQVIAEVAELATTQQRRVSQVIAEVAYTPLPSSSTGSGTTTGAGGRTGSQYDPHGEIVTWTVNNRAAEVIWDTLTAKANGGYEQVDLVTPYADGRWRGTVNRSADVDQGAIVRAYRDNGDILWEGMVAAKPQSFQGKVSFWCVGAVESLRRNASRLPYQLAGDAGWTDRTGDPFNQNNNAKFDLISKEKLIGWNLSTSESYAVGNKAGFALYVTNSNLKRIAFTINKDGTNKDTVLSQFDLELYVTDDAGALPGSPEKTWTMGGSHPDGDTIDYTFSGNGNTLYLLLTANGAGTVANRARLMLTHLRVNGIGTDDDWTTAEVIANLAKRCDYLDTRILPTGTAAFPLDWEGSWADLADAEATIDDWVWTVLADPSHHNFGSMSYGPWGGEDKERTWQGVVGEGLNCELTILPRYNRVEVSYQNPPGVEQTLIRDATDVDDLTDPLRDDVYPYPEVFRIEDPVDTNETPRNLADNALRRLTKLRAQGSITVSRLLNGAPYDILPGDLINIGGFNPALPAQRIDSVDYQLGGTCRIQVERSFSTQDLAARVFRKRLRRHRGRR